MVDDRFPSMKLDERYYYFGCQAIDDAIGFAVAYLHLFLLEKTRLLDHDFDIPYTEHGNNAKGLYETRKSRMPNAIERVSSFLATE